MTVYKDTRRFRDPWVYDFRHKKVRHWAAFSSEAKAKQGERTKRMEIAGLLPKSEPAAKPIVADVCKSPSTILPSTTPITFLQVCTSAIQRWEEADHDKEWIRTKSYILKKHFQDWMLIGLDQITPNLIRERMLGLKSDISAEASNRYLKILRATFNAARIIPNPTDGLEFLPRMDQPAGQYVPTRAEFNKLLLHAGLELQDYLSFSYHTLCRPFEAQRARWADVDFRRGIVALWTRKKAKDRSWTPREIPMNESLRKSLLRQQERCRPEEPLIFPNPRTRDAFLRRPKVLRTLCLKAGIRPFHWRGLRKASATELLDAGVALPVISKLLGHTNVQTTMIYLGIDDTAKREAVAVLNGRQLKQSFFHSESHSGAQKGMHNGVQPENASPCAGFGKQVVGKEGFEPSTSCSRSMRGRRVSKLTR